VSTTVLTRAVTRFIARLLPSTETYATREHELLGQTGIAELDIHARFGVANVRAPDGSLMKIRCRADQRIAKGSQILVTDYEPGLATYTVVPAPEL
jgi:membrane protein implicated in regulation of membrane protease activity